jgi:hypothetical protein
MAQNAEVAVAGRLTDQISLGVLASAVPRDAVDDAVAEAGRWDATAAYGVPGDGAGVVSG